MAALLSSRKRRLTLTEIVGAGSLRRMPLGASPGRARKGCPCSIETTASSAKKGLNRRKEPYTEWRRQTIQAFDHGRVLLADYPLGTFRRDREGVFERRFSVFVTIGRHLANPVR